MVTNKEPELTLHIVCDLPAKGKHTTGALIITKKDAGKKASLAYEYKVRLERKH